jgi:hypothetical protein
MQPGSLCSSIYRQSKLGDSLVEALDVMIKDEKITPDLAYKVLGEVKPPPSIQGLILHHQEPEH